MNAFVLQYHILLEQKSSCFFFFFFFRALVIALAKFHAKYFRSLRKAFASWFGWHHLMSTAPPPTLPSRSAEQGADLGYLADPHLNGSQQQQRRARAETAIGDPRRRPRWGVPIRFNVQSLIVQVRPQ